jgi:predicted amidohydrolase
VRVSLIQFAAVTDTAENLEVVTGMVTKAAATPASQRSDGHLIVLPEGAMHDFGAPDLPLGPAAQSLDGEFVTALARLAGKVGATIVAGMFEASNDPDRPFNTVVVIGRQGELVARYRKTHLYDSFGYRESARMLAGDGVPVVVPFEGLTLGLLTCYDLRFPELARALVDAGADTLVVPAAWVRGPAKEDHWATLLRARAIENTSFVLGAGQSGPSYIGSSMVVDPMGVVVSGLGAGAGVATADLDPRVIGEVRRRNPSLANRRMPPAS